MKLFQMMMKVEKLSLIFNANNWADLFSLVLKIPYLTAYTPIVIASFN